MTYFYYMGKLEIFSYSRYTRWLGRQASFIEQLMAVQILGRPGPGILRAWRMAGTEPTPSESGCDCNSEPSCACSFRHMVATQVPLNVQLCRQKEMHIATTFIMVGIR
jgi:hypothetical protein